MISIQTEFPLKGYIDSRIGGRDENQDSCGFADTPLGFLVTVCDGMGGMRGGSTASSLAVKTLLEDVKAAAVDADPTEVLTKAIKHANSLVIQTGQSDPNLFGMGTTLTVMLINTECAYCSYVGDSRIYQLHGKKKIFRTFDDSVVFQMVKSGLIKEEQARTASNSNVILKAIGVDPNLEVTVSRLSYNKGDRFLLCSDGFWGNMPEAEFLALVGCEGDLELIFERAFGEIEDAGIEAKQGYHDNLTCAIFDTYISSKYRTKMEKTLKVVSCVLAALLLASLGINGYLYTSSYALKSKLKSIELAQEGPSEQPDSTCAELLPSSKNDMHNSAVNHQ